MIRVKENPIKMRVSDAVMIKGEPGDPGASAYEIWLAQGNTGTADEFLESLKGEPGEKGDPGAKGNPGEKGDPGDDYVLTEADKTEIAEQAAALIDTSLLTAIGSGVIE